MPSGLASRRQTRITPSPPPSPLFHPHIRASVIECACLIQALEGIGVIAEFGDDGSFLDPMFASGSQELRRRTTHPRSASSKRDRAGHPALLWSNARALPLVCPPRFGHNSPRQGPGPGYSYADLPLPARASKAAPMTRKAQPIMKNTVRSSVAPETRNATPAIANRMPLSLSRSGCTATSPFVERLDPPMNGYVLFNATWIRRSDCPFYSSTLQGNCVRKFARRLVLFRTNYITISCN